MLIKSTAEYQCQGAKYDLYIARPEAAVEVLPTILVAPAWDGLNAPIKANSHKIAELGYAAVVIDVYGKGVRGQPTGDNSHLMDPLIEDRSVLKQRLTAAFDAIKAMSFVDTSRLGAVGYCFGGLCVLDLARSVAADLKGVVSFHGGLQGNGLQESKPILARILIEHGWADPMAPQNDFLDFTSEMDERNADWQAHIHGGAMHAFTFKDATFPELGIQYHEAAASRSWKSMCDFFEEVFSE